MMRIGILSAVLGILALATPLYADEPEAVKSADAADVEYETTLDGAIQAVYAGDHAQATKILSVIIANHRKDPNYFVVHALSRIVAGRGRERSVVSALQTSERLGNHSPETNAILALIYRRLRDDEKADENLKLAGQYLANDPLYQLVVATDLLMQRQWDKVAVILEKLAASEGPLAEEAEKRHKELKTFLSKTGQNELDLRVKMADLTSQREKLSAKQEKKNAEKEEIEADRKEIKTRYDAERAEAHQDYENKVAIIQSRYEDLMDQADDNDDLERDIERWRETQLKLAKQSLDRDYAKIDQKFEPDVNANGKKLDAAKRDLLNLKKETNALRRPETLLKRDLRKFENQEPFDIDAYWRSVALWLARVPLERPALPGPKLPPPVYTTPAEPSAFSEDDSPADPPDDSDDSQLFEPEEKADDDK